MGLRLVAVFLPPANTMKPHIYFCRRESAPCCPADAAAHPSCIKHARAAKLIASPNGCLANLACFIRRKYQTIDRAPARFALSAKLRKFRQQYGAVLRQEHSTDPVPQRPEAMVVGPTLQDREAACSACRMGLQLADTGEKQRKEAWQAAGELKEDRGG